MSETTGISWTDSTWTPIQAIRRDTGKKGCACVKISPGCKNCYSETLQLRNLPKHGTGLEFTVLNMEKVDIVVNEEILLQPLKWKKPRMIFVCSQTDLFGEFVADEQIDRVFAVMAAAYQHTFQVLTKRADRMAAYFNSIKRRLPVPGMGVSTGGAPFCGCVPGSGRIHEDDIGYCDTDWPLPNVWLGVSAENQEWADKRIPFLLQTPAAKRFLSIEPMLGPVDIAQPWLEIRMGDLDAPVECNLDWIICGGESGSGARPMRVEWAEALQDQCRIAGIPFFLKQLGANPIWVGAKCAPIEPARGKCDNPLEWPESLRVQQFPTPATVPDAGGAR